MQENAPVQVTFSSRLSSSVAWKMLPGVFRSDTVYILCKYTVLISRLFYRQFFKSNYVKS